MNQNIEYTKLDPTITSREVREMVKLAIDRKYRAVVLPYTCLRIAQHIKKLYKSDVKVVTVYGFPFDKYNQDILTTYKNMYDDLDVVIPIKEYYSNKNLDKVKELLNQVRKSLPDKKVKLIIETLLMTDKEKQIKEICELCKECKIDIVKTNTGLIKRENFAELLDDIKIIKKYWKGEVKAAGGIKKREQVKQLLDLGVNYIGTSQDIGGETNA